MKTLIVCSFVLLSIVSREAHSQNAIEPGKRIRVTVPAPKAALFNRAEGRFSGTLMYYASDSLTLSTDAGSNLSFALSDVRRIEISRGPRSNAGRGTLMGAAWGGAMFGAMAAVSAANPSPCEGTWFCYNPTPREAATLGFISGVVLGSIVGLVAGAATTSEKWTKLSSPAGIVLTPMIHPRGAGLTITM